MNRVHSSYNEDDVEVLLKDITGKISGTSTAERERLIQAGAHYCEMLPIEYAPSKEYYSLYEEALEKYSRETAEAVAVVSERVLRERGNNVVLVSLARAGTPIGILMKRYIKNKYGLDIKHYTVSIIRGKGIDRNAMNYILDRHDASDVQFVDGWTGKGAILKTLQAEISKFTGVSEELAVLADPANICKLCGTHEDFLIPSSCLNSTVTGLMSRTVLRRDLIDEEAGDFHGAVYYSEMAEHDVSMQFIDKIESCLKDLDDNEIMTKAYASDAEDSLTGMDEVVRIKEREGVHDINYVKPGIGETARVLLRRVPWKVLVKDKTDTSRIGHILRLAEEKGVEVIEDKSLVRYNCIGIIKDLADA